MTRQRRELKKQRMAKTKELRKVRRAPLPGDVIPFDFENANNAELGEYIRLTNLGWQYCPTMGVLEHGAD